MSMQQGPSIPADSSAKTDVPVQLENRSEIGAQWLGHILSGGSLDCLLNPEGIDKEYLYAAAHHLYIRGCYDEALPLFASLVITHQLERRFLFALGSCLQMLGRHESALHHYLTAAVLDPNEPNAVFHASECLIALGHTEEAREGLLKAIELSDRDRHEPVKVKAEALLTLMNTQKRDH